MMEGTAAGHSDAMQIDDLELFLNSDPGQAQRRDGEENASDGIIEEDFLSPAVLRAPKLIRSVPAMGRLGRENSPIYGAPTAPKAMVCRPYRKN